MSNIIDGGVVLPLGTVLFPGAKVRRVPFSAACVAGEPVQWDTTGLSVEPADASGTLRCLAGACLVSTADGDDTVLVVVSGPANVLKNTGAAIAAGDQVYPATGKKVSLQAVSGDAQTLKAPLGSCLIAADSSAVACTVFITCG